MAAPPHTAVVARLKFDFCESRKSEESTYSTKAHNTPRSTLSSLNSLAVRDVGNRQMMLMGRSPSARTDSDHDVESARIIHMRQITETAAEEALFRSRLGDDQVCTTLERCPAAATLPVPVQEMSSSSSAWSCRKSANCNDVRPRRFANVRSSIFRRRQFCDGSDRRPCSSCSSGAAGGYDSRLFCRWASAHGQEGPLLSRESSCSTPWLTSAFTKPRAVQVRQLHSVS
jgi:hypothetical protein